jgi:Glycosyltransferases involved in cell wall biogenesis
MRAQGEDTPVRSESTIERGLQSPPYFSICIPQHNRTQYLIAVCHSIAGQSFTDLEVCIADDCSSDGGEGDLLDYLRHAGVRFVYKKQQTNVRYDANLRTAIGLASGKFVLLLGNDDALAHKDVLAQLHRRLESADDVGVVITNFEDFTTGKVTWRMRHDGDCGAGPEAAVRHFRDLAFVSGVIIDRKLCKRFETAEWDGSEMYQMYLGTAAIAGGSRLLAVRASCIRKDVAINGELTTNRYASVQRLKPCPIVPRQPTLALLGRVAAAAILPFVPTHKHSLVSTRIMRQILIFTYPYWLVEYRRVQSWRYSLGVSLTMRPSNSLYRLPLDKLARASLALTYAVSTVAAMIVPIRLFAGAKPLLYRLAKRSSAPTQASS